jgi:hypothetical protein
MTPKQIHFINEICLTASEPSSTPLKIVHRLWDEPATRKLTDEETDAITYLAEKLQIGQWYLA